MKKQVIKVIIADDHDIIRQGLKRIIDFEGDICIIDEAENGKKVLALLDTCKPDVILLDCNMPFMDGIEVLRTVKEFHPSIKVVMLTVENDKKTIHTAIQIGADGYVLKDSAGTEIVQAIKRVYRGEKYIDYSLVDSLFWNIKNEGKQENHPFQELSRRELEVLMTMSKGLSNKEAAEKLYLSEKTVKNYATNLFKKLKVYDRVQATIMALQNDVEAYYKMHYKK